VALQIENMSGDVRNEQKRKNVKLRICGVEIERRIEQNNVIQKIQIKHDGEMMDVVISVLLIL
jgi:hypothetical protein